LRYVGSAYADCIDKAFPSTQVGYVKTSFMAFDMQDYNGLSTPENPFVDPYKAAALHNKARAVAFTLPGSNVRYKGLRVQDGCQTLLQRSTVCAPSKLS